MANKPIVLFLCTGNSCRSQMAEGFLRGMAGDRFTVLSAGTDPNEEVHPLAIEVMAEKGIDISGQRPKGVGEFLGHIRVHHLIIVCAGANESCPRIWPGMINRMFWPFSDPAGFVGSPEATREKFCEVCNEIEAHISQWLAEVRQPAAF